MRHREKFPVVSVCGLLVVLVLGLPAPVRADCPAGWRECAGEDTLGLCVPPGTECGTPDSSSIECALVCNVEVVLLANVGTMEADLMASEAAHARVGSQLEAIVRTDRAAPFEVAVVREGDGRWVFRAAAVGSRTAAPGTVRLLSGGRTVATRTVAGRAGVAEAPEFPSGIAVATSSRGTSIRWTYSAPVSVRLSAVGGRPAGAVEADAVEIGFASGATGPLRALGLHAIGIGPLAAAHPELAPAARPRRSTR